jgi:hypothetical protein
LQEKHQQVQTNFIFYWTGCQNTARSEMCVTKFKKHKNLTKKHEEQNSYCWKCSMSAYCLLLTIFIPFFHRPVRKNLQTTKFRVRKTGQRGKVVNAEYWSTERWSTGKTGQCGKVFNAERWSTENWSTGEKRINAKFWHWKNNSKFKNSNVKWTQ